MVKGFTHVADREKQLIKNMRKAGLTWTKIQEITGRSSKTIDDVLASKKSTATRPKGAPTKLPPKVMGKLLKVLTSMQKQAKGRKEITARMITEKAGVKVADRTFRDAYMALGGGFSKLKEGPILTDEDVKKRAKWCGGRKNRTKKGWNTKPKAIIDSKRFQMFLTEAGRDHVARRGVRGAYLIKGQPLQRHLMKPKGGNMKFPAPGVTVTAAIIRGRVRVWHYSKKWNGQEAAAFYKVLSKAMKKAYPEHAAKPCATWSVLEDNDPAGFKSSKARAAKKECGIITDDLPPRSPALNPLDYAVWSLINKAMRVQERKFRATKKETMDEFKARLRKTALGMRTSLISKCVGDMRRRCGMILQTKPPGGPILE